MKAHRIISFLLLIALLLTSLSFWSCGQKKTKFSTHSFDFFDTATTITGYETTKEEFDRVSEEILLQLGEYHRLFTIYHRFDGMENLCTVNELQDGAHPVVTVDRRIVDMLKYAKEMYETTDGKVNIAMGSVLSIWHDYRSRGLDEPWSAELPPTDQLREAAKHTDIECLIIDEEASTVWLSDPKMSLDVGAVAKGYAVEMVAESLEEQGITGYVLNVGGNVRTIGSKPEGEPWTAGIENPMEDADEEYLEYLHLAGESLVTSGSYQRYYTVNGVNYHHIIDPNTLFPAEGYLSVSVVCKSSALGDALSTALFCMSPEEGLTLVESLSGVEAMWVMADESRQYSSGFGGYNAPRDLDQS